MLNFHFGCSFTSHRNAQTQLLQIVSVRNGNWIQVAIGNEIPTTGKFSSFQWLNVQEKLFLFFLLYFFAYFSTQCTFFGLFIWSLVRWRLALPSDANALFCFKLKRKICFFFFLLPNWAERKQKDKICFWCAQTRKTVKHEFLWVPNAPKLLNCWNCSTASVIQSWRDVEWIWREHKNAFTYFRLMRGESLTVCVLPADLDNDTRTLSTVKAREFGSFRFCYWLPRIE